MRMFSLRRILAVSLVLMATVPALLVAWLLTRGSLHAAEELAGTILSTVAARVQLGTEVHLGEAHKALNGLLPESPGPGALVLARSLLNKPATMEAMAFALTHQSPDVPNVFLGNRRGEYFGVDNAGSAGSMVVVRDPLGAGRNTFLASQPGDRSRPMLAEDANFEPRTRHWYQLALESKGRVFSAVRPVPGKPQLYLTLSQPVYDEDGGAAGVFGVDLYLQQLADLLQTQNISARGAAFVVDEAGLLVASSAGDALLREVNGKSVRRSPAESANAAIRQSHAAVLAERAHRSADSVATKTTLRRLPLPGDALLMVQRPFAEALGLRWTLVVAAPESDFTADIQRAWRVSLAAMAGLVLLATLVAFLVAHGLGRRLRRLSEAAEQLGRGEVPVIEHRTRISEVHQLSRVLHDSAEQLRGFRHQVDADAKALQRANETLEARVEQRTAQLAASREEALTAARAKAAFLATMSHEIRTPLNGVVGMSTLLAETKLDAEQRDYLQTVRLSSDQLLSVINDVLDFSKIESGKLDLEAEPVSVRGAVEEACDIAAPRAREKGLELIIDIPETGPGAVPQAIRGDVTRMRQVLINLINNAVKFTASGEVTVQARQLAADDGQGRCVIEFRVTDSGIGIPADRLGTLFEAFNQVDASTTRRYGGTGLGLAISKRLVGLMAGQIGVESVAGKGSTFWFTVAAPQTELAQAFTPADVGLLKAIRTLVVDDHATNVRILTRQLQLWGMDVASAESGAQALEWLQRSQQPPDIIVTDMHMPDMDGVSLARTIKANPAWRDIPLILLSSGFMPSGDENAQLFQARLLKPSRQNQLFETILRCVTAEAAPSSKTGSLVTDVKKNVTVLVADDNAVNLKVACAMLLKLGYEVRTAVDGREAVEAVARAAATGLRLGAILMDVNMPDVDGLQATRQIQAVWGTAAPPIIALTAAASTEDRVRCEEAGMNDYLTKPLQVAALAQTLEKWLGNQEPAPPGVAAPVPEALLMDFSRLQEFRDFDDQDLSMTREVVGLFLGDAPARLQAMEDALAAGDAQALARAAHALKGAASNIGAIALQQTCGQLEDDARTAIPADAVQRLLRLRGEWEKTRLALVSWS
ncbi:response regulator [uncultured Ramlibacter sp.]|uniref:response regulator n=1 Tax=uncultured Ramlibacter sp. TaxID=260755 RepID=UPI00263598E4|nr:response regulator [uncultured Ramlibacter sp.]